MFSIKITVSDTARDAAKAVQSWFKTVQGVTHDNILRYGVPITTIIWLKKEHRS